MHRDDADRAGAAEGQAGWRDRQGILVWKRWIPDAGGALPGGVGKASLVRRDRDSLPRLVLETRRAELVHWLLLPAGLLTALWLPPVWVVVNMLFALALNLPCLLLQRYNRARLLRCLKRFGPCSVIHLVRHPRRDPGPQGPSTAACSSRLTASPGSSAWRATTSR